ncbi:MAG: NAD(P)H-hydrate dehydratase [Caulobacteraceae bacterium]
MTEDDTPALWLDRFPWPGAGTHKHTRGSLVVVSGAMPMTGAARLAAKAGLRIGAGLVTVLTPPDALMVHAAALDAVMVRPFSSAEALAALAGKADAAVIGPGAGVGEATRANVAALAGLGLKLVLDADALMSFEGVPEALFRLMGPDAVLTPHEGEFERLFPGLLANGRETAAAQAARMAGCIVLLKGPRTLIAAPDGRLAVNVNAPPDLATAGSGDVLAGLIGGLLAQGMPSFEAACAAAWIHGDAAHRFGPGLTADDLPGMIPKVLRGMRERALG